jgi:hypothetical protein
MSKVVDHGTTSSPRRCARKLRRRAGQMDGAAALARRIEAAGQVTLLSLQVLATCSETEARLAGAHPTSTERYEVVVDALAALMAGEIASLRRGEGP